ncbi:Cytochrome P450 76C4 [Panicum miliaceum]|uniref:Cytochrome P450 76C4 n=1 Tax=Panicum miliaceum TaxID=4540 RepID=A0A3L6RKW4_PANMI|nr:Cytochrome P450 76C4 [Panicum miliaceum]
METELWLLWATLAVSLLYYLSSLRRGTGASRLPPGPRPLPLVGNLLDLRGHLHHTLARLARAHGPVMRLRLGLTTAVVVSSRDAARGAFATHDRRLAARAVPDAARALGFSERSMIWLPSSDPRWKALRGVVAAHVFSPRSLAAVRGVRERKVRDLVGYLRGRAGREVDVGQAVYGGVLNLVSSAFFSIDVVDVGAESAQGLRELVEAVVEAIAKPNVSDLLPFLRRLDLQGWRRWTGRRYEEIFRVLDGIIDRRLAEASSSRDTHGDFLDALLELLHRQDRSRQPDDHPVRRLRRRERHHRDHGRMGDGRAARKPEHHGQGARGARRRSRQQRNRRGARRGEPAVPPGRGEGGDAAAPGGADTAPPSGRGGRRRGRRLHGAQGQHRDLQRLGDNAGPGGVGEAGRVLAGAVLGRGSRRGVQGERLRVHPVLGPAGGCALACRWQSVSCRTL